MSVKFLSKFKNWLLHYRSNTRISWIVWYCTARCNYTPNIIFYSIELLLIIINQTFLILIIAWRFLFCQELQSWKFSDEQLFTCYGLPTLSSSYYIIHHVMGLYRWTKTYYFEFFCCIIQSFMLLFNTIVILFTTFTMLINTCCELRPIFAILFNTFGVFSTVRWSYSTLIQLFSLLL
jgi:hypothetical protein